MIRVSVRLLLLALAFALGTVVLGWWAVPVIGLAWGVIDRSRPAAAWIAALAAGLGWDGLLSWAGVEGPIGRLAAQVGSIMGIPGWGLVVATLLLPMLLAGTAAMVGAGIAGKRERGSEGVDPGKRETGSVKNSPGIGKREARLRD